MTVLRSLRLATRDYLHEWQMSGCFVLALAAVLGPMLVLFGLKFGIVGGMIDQLIEDPVNREIRPVGSGSYTGPWLQSLAAREDVAFLVPRTRSIAATIELKSANAGRIVRAEVIPSAAGDPLLPDHVPGPEGVERVVLSAPLAEKLDVQAGDFVNGSLLRRYQGQKERVHVPLEVASIAPAKAFSRDGAFAALPLVESLEDYRDGHRVAAFGWPGAEPPVERTYPGFRLYARSIYDVAGLRAMLDEVGVEVNTQAGDIELVQRMDRNLTTVFWAIAAIGMAGFSLSLGASLWANVDRKRKDLAVLRLVGFGTGDIVWFPMTQAFYTAALGWLLAIAIYYGVSYGINNMLSTNLASGEQVCRLLPGHLLISLVLTVGAALLAAALAGMRSARIEPSEGLREI